MTQDLAIPSPEARPVSNKKIPSVIYFIDRNNFTQLLNKDVAIEDLMLILKNKHTLNETQKNKVNKFSLLTKKYILEFNNILNRTLFENLYYNIDYYFGELSDIETKYINHSIKDYLTGENKIDIVELNRPYSSENKKYYEIIPILNSNENSCLIVVEQGFFNNLTKNKHELITFMLDCLSHQYNWNCLSPVLLKLYLSLQINDSQFDLVKLRFNSPR